MYKKSASFRDSTRKLTLWAQALLLAIAGSVPLLMANTAHAAPVLLERELQTTTGRPSQTTDLTWIFDTTADVASIDYIEIEFCDSPLGVCSAPANIPAIAASPTATLSNFTSNGVTGTTRENGLGGGTNNQIQVDKTTVDAGASLNEATISLAPTDITNDSAANTTYYTRMRIFSDTGTTLVWEGVFAQSTSQTLTVNARVQERLDFCVGATAVDDATSAIAASCAAVTGTDVNIGNVESGLTNVSPVNTVNGGDDENGLAMVRTNAVNGAVVDYKAIQDTSSGKLKVPSAACSGVTTTDQCFNSVGTTQDEIDAGVEEFGLAVAGINCQSVQSYTCTFAAGTYNLIRDDNYDGVVAGQDNTTYNADDDQVGATTTGAYAWDDTGTADRIASSAASAVKVIDDEALVLKFAATASATTPTGSYSVQTDFFATTTF